MCGRSLLEDEHTFTLRQALKDYQERYEDQWLRTLRQYIVGLFISCTQQPIAALTEKLNYSMKACEKKLDLSLPLLQFLSAEEQEELQKEFKDTALFGFMANVIVTSDRRSRCIF